MNTLFNWNFKTSKDNKQFIWQLINFKKILESTSKLKDVKKINRKLKIRGYIKTKDKI